MKTDQPARGQVEESLSILDTEGLLRLRGVSLALVDHAQKHPRGEFLGICLDSSFTLASASS